MTTEEGKEEEEERGVRGYWAQRRWIIWIDSKEEKEKEESWTQQ